MNPSSIDTLKNNFFEIQNVNSSFNQYYHLTSPYNAVIETYRDTVEEIHRRGHELACHGYQHESSPELTREEMEEILDKSESLLFDITGKPRPGKRASGLYAGAFSEARIPLQFLHEGLRLGLSLGKGWEGASPGRASKRYYHG